MREPARLHRQEEIHVSPFNFGGWLLLHPTAIILALTFALFFLGALMFAVSGHAAVESGSMRNFLVTGV